MKIIDAHTHSEFSPDAEFGSMALNLDRALSLGLDGIGFSDHHEMDQAGDFGPAMMLNYEYYCDAVEQMRKKADDRLDVYRAVEIGYTSFLDGSIKEWLKDKEFDYIIGSVHQLEHHFIVNSNAFKNEEEYIIHALEYYRAVLDSVDSGIFDVIAHISFYRRFLTNGYLSIAPIDIPEIKNIITLIFEQMIENEMILEINISALRQGLEFTLPEEPAIALYRHLGGRLVSYASDAHQPENIGGYRERFMEIVQRYGLQVFVPDHRV